MHEAKSTEKMLEAVPDNKLTWKPHDKSMTMVNLFHIADIPNLMYIAVEKMSLILRLLTINEKKLNQVKNLWKYLMKLWQKLLNLLRMQVMKLS